MSIAAELTALARPRVLFVRLDNAGDVVLLSPAARTVKTALPGCSLTLWTTKAGAQAAPLLPEVDEVVVSRPVWQEVGNASFDPEDDRRLILDLRNSRLDAAFVFTSFSQTPHPAAALCSLAGIPRRAGSPGQRAGGGLLFEAAPPPFAEHQADRNLSLLREAGFPDAGRSLRLRVPAWEPPGDEPPRGYVVVSPWASCDARSYPAGRMLEAARMIAAARGWTVYIVGREKEKDLAAGLRASRAGGSVARPQARSTPGTRLPAALRQGALQPGAPYSAEIDLVGGTTIPRLAALVAGADLVFCNNSLVMHLADATQTPAVVAYAGTDVESQWTPRDTPHRLLRRETSCAPCFLMTCPNRHRCLDIPAEEMAAEAEALLARTSLRWAPVLEGPASPTLPTSA